MDNLLDPYGDPFAPTSESACSLCGNAFHSRSKCPWGRSLFETLFGPSPMVNSSYHEELAAHLASSEHPKPHPQPPVSTSAGELHESLEHLFDLCEQQYQRQAAEMLEGREREKGLVFALGFVVATILVIAAKWAVKALGAV